jgi:hypothetical protein
VIEHIDDAPAFLRLLPEFLPSLTKLLITVPARAELWSAWDDHFGHVRRYDLDLLRCELNAAGLSPVVSRYFFQSLYLPMHLTKRRRRAAIKPPSMTWAHRIVGAAMTAEQWIVPSRVPGASIIAMVEVPARHLT